MNHRMDRASVMDALNCAIKQRGATPDILHQDRGSLYAMVDYRALLARYAVRESMNRKADCWDNAPM